MKDLLLWPCVVVRTSNLTIPLFFSFCQNKSTKHIKIRAARALYVQPTRSMLRVRGDN